MTTSKRLLYIFISLLFILNNCAKKENFVLKIKDSKIPLSEFESRLNFVPHPSQFLPDTLLKEQLAASLVAERIFALEAVKNKLDTMARVKRMIHEYEKEAVYEKWMKENIRNKIKLSESESRKAYSRFVEQRIVDYLVLPDSASAVLAEKKLKHTSAEEELKGTNFNLKTKTIDYAEAWKPVEDEIFNLKIGEVSKPIDVDGKYYVFRLKKVVPHPIFSKYDYNYWKPSIERRLKAQKEMKIFDAVIADLMHDKRFTIKREVYEFVLNKLIHVIPFRKDHALQAPEMINMELGKVPTDIKKYFDKPFLLFQNGAIWTIGDFWERLSLGPYLLNYGSAEEFRHALPDLIREMVIIETVIEKGYKQGLQHSKYVRQQTEMWKANLLAKLYQQSILDTIHVSKKEIMKYYRTNKNRYRVKRERRKILEILVNNRELAVKLLKEIIAGQDMEMLAKKFSIRQIPKKDIEQGFYITRNSWGKIGKIAFSLSPGQLFGPIKLADNRYSIIKLIDILKPAPEPFEKVQDKVHADVLTEKAQRIYEKLLSDRIRQYAIEINFDALKHIKVLKGNMLVLKSHFPTRSAVPTPLYWVVYGHFYQQFKNAIWKKEKHYN